MRVLQIIDSLHPGGAERMAVNYANILFKNDIVAHICVTRKEGLLNKSLNSGVFYLYLKKKHSLDIKAFLKLRKYIIKHRIELLHCHSSSFFIATLIKITYPQVKLIWHDHYGNGDFLEERRFAVLKLCSYFFDGIISVNEKLRDWAKAYLVCSKTIFLPNFTLQDKLEISEFQSLKGQKEFKIICIANLRPQKDHLNLIKAFEKCFDYHPMSLHLIGENPETEYSKNILTYIKNSKLKNHIYYYGVRSDIQHLLSQADVGVLSSLSEGLPVALLEYGNSGLPVICTDVGKCSEVVSGFGRVTKPNSYVELADNILFYYKNPEIRIRDAKLYNNHVSTNYSNDIIINEILKFYNNLL
jgi:glycosyltransferase involved in cell wall biosynthesis